MMDWTQQSDICDVYCKLYDVVVKGIDGSNAFEKTDLLTDEQKDNFVVGLNQALKGDSNENLTCNCAHDYHFAHARRVLDQIGLTTEAVEACLKFFKKNGGYCDCEIMFNVVCGD